MISTVGMVQATIGLVWVGGTVEPTSDGERRQVESGDLGGLGASSTPPPTPFEATQPRVKICRKRKKSCAAREGDDGEEGDGLWKRVTRAPGTNDHLGFHHRHHRHHGAWGWPEARLTPCTVSNTDCTASGKEPSF